MNGTFEIIGTNEPLNYLKGKSFKGDIIHDDNVHSLTMYSDDDSDNKKYNNMRLLCSNCYFTNVGNFKNSKQFCK